jgi:hypothetical protein
MFRVILDLLVLELTTNEMFGKDHVRRVDDHLSFRRGPN